MARLSGSTAEFLHMWQLMFFGQAPFRMEGGTLCLGFRPFLPDYLIPEDGVVEAVFLGKTRVRYEGKGCRAFLPGKTLPVRYDLTFTDGHTESVSGDTLRGAAAEAVRAGQVSNIHVTMMRDFL